MGIHKKLSLLRREDKIMIGLATFLPAIVKLADKFIEDKDKKAEFANKAMNAMLENRTYKWVDALVKLSYASEQIMKGLFRPIGAAVMTGFAMWASYKGVDLDTAAQAVLYGAFPAWGASRHSEKKTKAEKPANDDEWNF